VIADNVGDNVGDVAVWVSDLYESYVGSIISAVTLGAVGFKTLGGVLFPLALAAVGVLSSVYRNVLCKRKRMGRIRETR
jgi:K(+)-stimulated pyrophosphate-energized sodium pump